MTSLSIRSNLDIVAASASGSPFAEIISKAFYYLLVWRGFIFPHRLSYGFFSTFAEMLVFPSLNLDFWSSIDNRSNRQHFLWFLKILPDRSTPVGPSRIIPFVFPQGNKKWEHGIAAAVIYEHRLCAVSADIMQSSADVSTTASRSSASRLMHGSHLPPPITFFSLLYPVIGESGEKCVRLHSENIHAALSFLLTVYRCIPFVSRRWVPLLLGAEGLVFEFGRRSFVLILMKYPPLFSFVSTKDNGSIVFSLQGVASALSFDIICR